MQGEEGKLLLSKAGERTHALRWSCIRCLLKEDILNMKGCHFDFFVIGPHLTFSLVVMGSHQCSGSYYHRFNPKQLTSTLALQGVHCGAHGTTLCLVCTGQCHFHPAPRSACVLRALGLLLADGAHTVGRGKIFCRVRWVPSQKRS